MREGYVYFIGAAGGGNIKVGHTFDRPEKRLGQIRMMSPVPLIGLAVFPGPYEFEQRLHGRFAAYRLHGEWFEPAEAIVAFIRRWARPWPGRETRDFLKSHKRTLADPDRATILAVQEAVDARARRAMLREGQARREKRERERREVAEHFRRVRENWDRLPEPQKAARKRRAEMMAEAVRRNGLMP